MYITIHICVQYTQSHLYSPTPFDLPFLPLPFTPPSLTQLLQRYQLAVIAASAGVGVGRREQEKKAYLEQEETPNLSTMSVFVSSAAKQVFF